MIEIDNKRFRNLQEQVAWLTLMINRATDIVKNIAGTAPDVTSLAPASTYSNGTTFAIGTAAPYDYYVALNGNWVELGTMPVAGPAGASGSDGSDGRDGSDGKNGNSIFITSQTTTSSTSSILTSSLYNPTGLAIESGNLIFSEQGDVFEITTPHPVACAVLWRCNLIGPTGSIGPSGTGTYYSSASTTSSTTNIAISTVYNPDSQTIDDGDIIISSTGDMFTVTGTAGVFYNVTYRTNIVGPQGATGDTGSILYNGSDLTYDALGLQVEVALSDVPDIRVDDYYLVASDYTDSGHDFYEGDVFVCTSVGVSTADLSYVCNIRGPQGSAGSPGSPGADGATIFYGSDIYHTGGSGGAYLIDKATIPTMKAGDYYLANATYTSDGETITNGTLWYALTDTGTSFYMTIVTSLVGPPADLVWGNITGTLTDQADLNTKLGTYLPKAGGTMTGAITTTQTTIIRRSSSASILTQGSTTLTLGRTALTALTFTTGAAVDIGHNRNGTTVHVLDAYNTKANESGATTPLTELTLDSTKYKVPEFGGGYTFTILGAKGAYTINIWGNINGVYGMHHITKAEDDTIYVDGLDTTSMSLTISNASICTFKSVGIAGLQGGTGNMYAADGTLVQLNIILSYTNQLLWLDSNVSVLYADS